MIEGDLITMIEIGTDGWSEVQLISTKEKGIVPTDYIELYDEEEEEEVTVFKPLLYNSKQALAILRPALKNHNLLRKLKCKKIIIKFSIYGL